MINSCGWDIDIEVDGGIGPDTISQTAKAGANIFVAGSAIFKSQNYAETIRSLREKIE